MAILRRVVSSWRSLAALARDSLLLIASMHFAAGLRYLLPFGKSLAAGYQAEPPILYALAVAAAAIIRALQLWRGWSDLAAYSLALLLTIVGALVIVSDVSQLQLGYAMGLGIGLGFTCVALPEIAQSNVTQRPLDHFRALWRYRFLVFIWLRYNILSRYSQTVLGILWIVLLPLITSLVLAFIFSEVLHIQLGNVPFVSFFLVALVPWNLFSQGIFGGTRAILGNLGLINQVYFPREILTLLALGESIVDFTFTFTSLLLINILYGLWPSIVFVHLLPLLAIQIMLTLGLMLFVSYLCVIVRDMPQLVAVIMQILFYLSPIIYPLDSIPEKYRWLAQLNPLVSLIQGYREVILFARPPHYSELIYPASAAIVVLTLGYLFFKQNESRLADLL